MKNLQIFFTTGELAQMTGISKPLLIYYDKKGVLVPSVTDDNGYRYYGLNQYFALKIILELRKLGLSLKEIQEYMSQSTLDRLQEIYSQQLSMYDEQIRVLENKKRLLTTYLKALEKRKQVRINQVYIQELEAPKQFYTWSVDFQKPVKERVLEIARCFLPTVRDPDSLLDNEVGTLLPKEFITLKNQPVSGYKLLLDMYGNNSLEKLSDKWEIHTMKTGMYLSMNGYFHNRRMEESKNAIRKFMVINSLEPVGPVYIFHYGPVWMTPHSPTVCKYQIQVQQKRV